MRIVQQSYEIETDINAELLKVIEKSGRTCYKSEKKITEESAAKFVQMLIDRGHHSVIEHFSITVRFVVDRGVSHEIVRHRLASYSQESTRYCNYTQDRFDNEITIIQPFGVTGDAYIHWLEAVQFCEDKYFAIVDEMKMAGVSEKEIPQWARSVLPNSLKTELVMTANVREWRHFFELRTAAAAHPQMREVARPLLEDFRHRVPIVFNDVGCVSDHESMRKEAFKRVYSKMQRRGFGITKDEFDGFWNELEKHRLEDGEPCEHDQCLSHQSHPCEGCGRIGGQSRK